MPEFVVEVKMMEKTTRIYHFKVEANSEEEAISNFESGEVIYDEEYDSAPITDSDHDHTIISQS